MAFWLLATQHCGLEAAGLLGNHDGEGSDCCVGTEGCSIDGCATVEDGVYRPDNFALAIAAPTLFETLSVIPSLISALRVEPPGIAGEQRRERPRDWVPSWPFVRRAALSPRAP